jgi:hypothetical protein
MDTQKHVCKWTMESQKQIKYFMTCCDYLPAIDNQFF